MEALKPFDYLEPRTVAEVVRLLSEYGGKAHVLAGGVDLVPRMRKGRIRAECLVNIGNIPGLDAIVEGEDGLSFGAMAKLYSLEKAEAIRNHYPTLHDAIHQISSIQTKHMGTAVGNICVGTPASDVATALFALDAELTISGADGERKESMEGFCVGYGCTSLKAHEIVTNVFLPASEPGVGTAFLNLVRTRSDIAKVSVAVAVAVKDGLCRKARIAVGAAAPTVFRAKKAESVLQDEKIDSAAIDRAAETAAGETRTISDLRSTAEYRKEMTRVLVGRALKRAHQQVAGRDGRA